MAFTFRVCFCHFSSTQKYPSSIDVTGSFGSHLKLPRSPCWSALHHCDNTPESAAFPDPARLGTIAVPRTSRSRPECAGEERCSPRGQETGEERESPAPVTRGLPTRARLSKTPLPPTVPPGDHAFHGWLRGQQQQHPHCSRERSFRTRVCCLHVHSVSPATL